MKKHIVLLGLLTLLFSLRQAEAAELKDLFSAGSLQDPAVKAKYAPPISGLLNESPYITTELRPIYAYHEIPDDSVVRGGHANVAALQIRLALSDRLGIIATKDGFTDIHFSQALPDIDGFNNLAAGAKYALVSKPEEGIMLTGGVRYEAPTGNLPTGGIDVAGSDGDGLIDVFVTGAHPLGLVNLQGSIGSNIALDQDKNSTNLHYSIHADYQMFKNFFPLIEFNGLTTLEEGKVIDLDLEGGDLMNIGTMHSGTVITMGLGARYRLTDGITVGAAWEPAITSRNDLHEERVYVDMVAHF